MILYATKQTLERYRLKLPEEFSDPMAGAAAAAVLAAERDDRLLEWGLKLFYFDRRKCLQAVNFASKLTFVLADVKLDGIPYVADVIAQYLLDIYAKDATMTALLERLFAEYPICAFSRLTDKSIIASLNHMQSGFLADGNRLYRYIRGNILQTRALNRELSKYLVTQKVDGARYYFVPREKFAEQLYLRYGKTPPKGFWHKK